MQAIFVYVGNDDVEDDEALARRLQEQEDALATRGRATRGALRVKHKPSQLAHKGSSREARHARGSASAAVRSSSRLKPQSGQGKQRPMTRGSAGNNMFKIVQESSQSSCRLSTLSVLLSCLCTCLWSIKISMHGPSTHY